jgi:hypothetical protein
MASKSPRSQERSGSPRKSEPDFDSILAAQSFRKDNRCGVCDFIAALSPENQAKVNAAFNRGTPASLMKRALQQMGLSLRSDTPFRDHARKNCAGLRQGPRSE